MFGFGQQHQQHGHQQKYTFNPNYNRSWGPAPPNKFGQMLRQKIGWVQGRSPRMMHKQNYYHQNNAEGYNQPQYVNQGVTRPYIKKRRVFHETNPQIKRRKFDEQRGGVANPAFDPFYNSVPVKRHTLNTIQENEQEIEEEEEEEIVTVKQKKKNVEQKKTKKMKKNSESEEIEEIPKQKKKEITKKSSEEESEDIVEIPKKKKKKTKKSSDVESEDIEIPKQKKKKTKKSSEQESEDIEEIPKQKKKKTKKTSDEGKKSKIGLENPNFVLDADESGIAPLDTTENFEVKRKIKKENQKVVEIGIVNPALDLSNESVQSPVNNALEVKRENIKNNDDSQGVDNPNFNDSDIMLNVTANSVEQAEKNELFNINTKVVANKILNNRGHVNRAFKSRTVNFRHKLHYAKRAIDNCQAEVENDFNEKRNSYPTVGDPDGDPNGENEKLEDGTKLKFKYATFSQRTPWYHLKADGPKKSYKHLIKGDIVLAFKNTNLHEIRGYGDSDKKNKQKEKPKVKRVTTLATSLRHTAVVKPTRMIVAGVRKPATYVTRRRMVPTVPAARFKARPIQFGTNYVQPTVKPRSSVAEWHRQPKLLLRHKQKRENYQGNQQYHYEENQQQNYQGNYVTNQQQFYQGNEQQYYQENQQQNYGYNQQYNYQENQQQFYQGNQQQNFQYNQQQYFGEQNQYHQQEYYPQKPHWKQQQHFTTHYGSPIMQKPRRFIKKQFPNYAMNQGHSNFVKSPMGRGRQPRNYVQHNFQNQQQHNGYNMNQASSEYY